MTRALIALVLSTVFACALVGRARADEVPVPASPTAWVTDNPALLTPATRDELNNRLAAYSNTTGRQIIVWIGTTTGDAPLEDWTIRAFTAWKVGRKGLDDGLVLFLFTGDRKARIEVGYGLEDTMTDAIASRIIREDIVPNMRAGDGDAAVTSAVSAILATIGGENGASLAPVAGETRNSNDLVVLIVVIFILLLFLIVRSRLGRYYTIGSGPIWFGGFGGGWGGGFGGGGGGFGDFSGGGGMGGGGGASGGW